MMILYLTVYLPTNTEFCIKISSQMSMSFNQMSCNNVYVSLLLRMANDVEENPGPTVYDVVDQNKVISENLGKMLVSNV